MDPFAPGEIPSIKYLCSVEIIPDMPGSVYLSGHGNGLLRLIFVLLI